VVEQVSDRLRLADTEFINMVEQATDQRVVLNHPVGVEAQTGLSQIFLLHVGEVMHPSCVEPAKERFVRLGRAVEEVLGKTKHLFIDRFHTFLGQRARVFDPAIGEAVNDASRSLFLSEFRILRVVIVFRFLLCVEVVEVAIELVETVVGRQKLILVAKMVLPELSGHIAERFEQLGNGRVFFSQSQVSARKTDFGQACSKWHLPSDECRATSGTALLRVVRYELTALFGEAVDVRRAVAHEPLVVGADIPIADVVSHDNEDVRLLLRKAALRASNQEA
jgi:hypothetical protein